MGKYKKRLLYGKKKALLNLFDNSTLSFHKSSVYSVAD